MASRSDHELVNEIKSGNRKALGELFDRYSPGLYEFIYRLIGDRDQTARLLEELFISVPLTIGGLTEDDSVVGWLYAQARESALTFLRQKGWLDALPPSDEPSVSGLAGDIWRAARAMPAFHRAVLVVEELLGLSPTEKAHALGVARTDLPRLVEEARRSFEYQFDLQARQFGRPIASQIDPERIWGMHRRIGDSGSLFGYLPAFVLPDSPASMIRNKVLTAARMPAPQMIPEPAPSLVEVIERPGEVVVIPAEPRSALSGCSWQLVGLALLVALLITTVAVVMGMFLTRDLNGPVVAEIQPPDNAVLSFVSTPGAPTVRVVISATYRDDRSIDPRSVRLVVDGRDVTTQTISTTLPISSTISYGADLEPGQHVVLLQVADIAGNKASRTWQFTIAGPPTPTPTPTLTPTLTAVPTATRTATPTSTSTPVAVPNILTFSATQTTIQRGQPVLLTWSVANADIVFLNQDRVDPSGNRMVTPTATTIYHLIANNAGGTVERSITITIQELPDLIVRDVFLTPSNQIGYVIRNDGTGDVTRPFLVQVTANGVVVYSDRPISSLPAGQEASLIVPNRFVVGTQTISVRANVLQEIQESNSGNNELVRVLNGPPPTPTFTPSPTPTFTPTMTPSLTPTPTPTFTPTATPSPGIVSSSVASVSPTIFSGSCPATFSFTATVSMTGPGTVTYRWERSDGSNLPPTSISFTAAGTQLVYDQWASAPLGTAWGRLHVGAPNDVLSNQATFTNNCK